jgi:chemotaxis signal transduction protein
LAQDIRHSVVPTRSTTTPPATAPLMVTFTTDALRRCGATRYAISAQRVAGVESSLAVVPVPGSESPVIGVSVWRGEVVPVLDARDVVAPRAVDRRRLLIVRCGGLLGPTSVAIPVDAEIALCQPTHNNPLLDPTPHDAEPIPPYVTGLFDVRGQTVALIDPDTLLDAACAGAGRESSLWTAAGPGMRR